MKTLLIASMSLPLALYQPLRLPHSVTFASFGFSYQPSSLRLSFSCLSRLVHRCCMNMTVHWGKNWGISARTYTFGVCLLYVKAFCKWTYCGFPDARRPPTHLLSACREQLVNKQLDHYLAILQTWHDFPRLFLRELCILMTAYKGTEHLVLDVKGNFLLDNTAAD